jgi:hypothetical protein
VQSLKKLFGKAFISLLSLVMVFSVAGGTVSAAASETVSDNEKVASINFQDMYSEKELDAIVDAIDIMDEYIISDGNQLVLDPSVKEEVSSFVYDHYANGIAQINLSINEGAFQLDEVNQTLEPTMTVDEIANNPILNKAPGDGGFSTQSYTKSHWYGVDWFLSKSEANRWQNIFDDYSFNWSSVAAIAGVIGAYFPPALVAAVAAIIMAVGNNHIHKEIRDNKSSKGTKLTFKWAPPSIQGKKR